MAIDGDIYVYYKSKSMDGQGAWEDLKKICAGNGWMKKQCRTHSHSPEKEAKQPLRRQLRLSFLFKHDIMHMESRSS